MPTTVDEIRFALEKRDGVSEGDMQTLASAYRDEVKRVNQRLDESVMLLRKGLRSEAIQRIEMRPNALELAVELDFPEWDEWNEILQFMAIPLPPRLNHEYISQINEAILEVLPLEALMRRHRRLAIAKAPLAARLKVLRQIARVDSDSQVWQRDIEVWEKTRLTQIDQEIQEALDAEDSRRTYMIHKELTAPGWITQPSSRLVQQCELAANAFLAEQMEGRLVKLAPKLLAAFESQDQATARKARAAWQSTVAEFNVPAPTLLSEQVEPALKWLEGIDRQAITKKELKNSLNRLQILVQQNAPMDQIIEARDSYLRFGEPVPEATAHEIRQRQEAPKRAARKKLILISGAVVVVLVGISIGVLGYLARNRHAADLERKQNDLQQLFDAGDFQGVIEGYTRLRTSDPELAMLPELSSLNKRAQSEISTEEKRVERFDRLYKQADSEDPALIDLSVLDLLRSLASTKDEETLVASLENRKTQYMDAQRDQQSDALLKELGQFQQEFDQLKSRPDGDETLAALRSLQSEVSRLENRYPKASSDAIGKQSILRSGLGGRIQEVGSRLKAMASRDSAMDSLVTARSLGVFADRLTEFSNQAIVDTKVIEFSKVSQEEELWESALSLNDWLQEFQDKLEGGLSAQEAASLARSSEQISQLVEGNPCVVELGDIGSVMKELTERRLLFESFIKEWEGYPAAQMYSLVMKNEDPKGIIYFVPKKYIDENRANFDKDGFVGVAVASSAGGMTKSRSFPGPLPPFSPQPREMLLDISSDIIKRRSDFISQWELEFLKSIQAVQKNPQLNGLLKEKLITDLLQVATRGSKQLAQKMSETVRVSQRRKQARDQWYIPGTFDGTLAPEFAEPLDLELRLALPTVGDPFAHYNKLVKRRLQWVGFLVRDSSGNMKYQLRQLDGVRDGAVYTAVPPTKPTGEVKLESIGSMIGGQIQLKTAAFRELPGRPLFLYPDSIDE